jgi:hypothetical protein
VVVSNALKCGKGEETSYKVNLISISLFLLKPIGIEDIFKMGKMIKRN